MEGDELVSSIAVGSEGSFHRDIRAGRAGRRGAADRKQAVRSSHLIALSSTAFPTFLKLNGEPNIEQQQTKKGTMKLRKINILINRLIDCCRVFNNSYPQQQQCLSSVLSMYFTPMPNINY